MTGVISQPVLSPKALAGKHYFNGFCTLLRLFIWFVRIFLTRLGAGSHQPLKAVQLFAVLPFYLFL